MVADPPNWDAHADSRLLDALERVGQAMRVQMRKHASEAGLSMTQAQLLMRIASVEETQREATHLAQWFDIRQPTVTDSVAALVRKGMVVRRPVAGDARRFRLEATSGGADLARRLGEWGADIRAELAGFDASAKGDALDLLLQLIGSLQRAGHLSVARTCTTCRFFAPDQHPGSATPHHCGLLDEPLSIQTLRLDCAEHEGIIPA